MAHNLTANDLLFPAGDLPVSLFPDKGPGRSAEDVLDLWLIEAQGKVASVAIENQNAAARHYVYAKAYRMKADLVGMTPSQKSEAGGSAMTVGTSWGSDRVKYWVDKADAEEKKFDYYVPAVPPSGNRPTFCVL